MTANECSREQLIALVKHFVERDALRNGLNQTLLETAAHVHSLDQALANFSAWAIDQNELTKRSALEIHRIIAAERAP